MKIDNAPTPHNTPASVLTGSFLKNGNPVSTKAGGNVASNKEDAIPQTISEEDIQSALSKQPFLLQSIQDKLGSLVGQDSGYVGHLPKRVKERIYGLKAIQSDLFGLEKDFQIEMFELEKKYLAKYSPLHERRSKLVGGVEEPTTEEVIKGKEVELEAGEEEEDEEEEEEEEEANAEDEEDDIKGIPSFWLTALENLPVVSDTITDRDAEILDFLTDIKLEYLTNGKPGFKLIFVFDEEVAFFKNKSLTKTYYYQNELGYSGDFIYDHAEGEKILWNDDASNATISVEMRKQRNKVTKQVRTIEKITPIDSFFNFFDPPKLPSETQEKEQDNDHVEDDQDEDELEELEQRLALDYSIGEQLKDKLIPRAIDWFTGAALEFEFDSNPIDEEFDEDEDEDDNLVDEEDDDEDDDDEDDDDDTTEPDDFAGKKEQPPECKQS